MEPKFTSPKISVLQLFLKKCSPIPYNNITASMGVVQIMFFNPTSQLRLTNVTAFCTQLENQCRPSAFECQYLNVQTLACSNFGMFKHWRPIFDWALPTNRHNYMLPVQGGSNKVLQGKTLHPLPMRSVTFHT